MGPDGSTPVRKNSSICKESWIAGAAFAAKGNSAADAAAVERISRRVAARMTCDRGVVAIGWKDEAKPVERRRTQAFIVE
jgi:hypothetical protein